MTPLSVLDLAPFRSGPRRPMRCATPSTSRGTPSGGATPLLAGRAPQHGRHRQRRDCGRDRLCRRRHNARSAWAPAGSCCPTMRPLIIAEQFGTLETLYPGRIDLGVGRAPGTDQRTLRALRRDPSSADTFPQDVLELQALLGPLQPGQVVQAVPGAGLKVPIWILGSSLFGAQLAAMLGLPYAFASHFAPDALMPALQVYRERFQPSEQLERPYAMVGVNVIAAETDGEARRLFTSAQQQFTNMLRGTRGQLPPPIDDIDRYWSPAEKEQVSKMLACSFVGSPEAVREGLESFVERTGADEVIVAAAIHDHAARLRSYELLAGILSESEEDPAGRTMRIKAERMTFNQ